MRLFIQHSRNASIHSITRYAKRVELDYTGRQNSYSRLIFAHFLQFLYTIPFLFIVDLHAIYKFCNLIFFSLPLRVVVRQALLPWFMCWSWCWVFWIFIAAPHVLFSVILADFFFVVWNRIHPWMRVKSVHWCVFVYVGLFVYVCAYIPASICPLVCIYCKPPREY